MKSHSINRRIRRNCGRGISEVIRRKEGFVVLHQRPFYIYNGNLCSPFSDDLLYVSNCISKSDYFKYFKQFNPKQTDINIPEIFDNFMKIEFPKDPNKYKINLKPKYQTPYLCNMKNIVLTIHHKHDDEFIICDLKKYQLTNSLKPSIITN